jgi:hypothetical protein
MSARSAGLSLLILNTFGALGGDSSSESRIGEVAFAGAASALGPGESMKALSLGMLDPYWLK